MYIAYFDETGDDGFPRYSSPLFALTVCYLHHLNWKGTFQQLLDYRRALSKRIGLPVKMEMHTKHFLLNKNPYRALGISDADRFQVIGESCDLLASLDVKFINAVIVKPRIQKSHYDVLDFALTCAIQRIENDLDLGRYPTNRFLIVTDEGRVGAMRKTSRRIQRINYIPSKFGPSSYRSDIRSLIEDPLPKNSKESYFIQASDFVGFIVYHYALAATGAGPFSNRTAALISPAEVTGWMDRLKPSLNVAASGTDPYGVYMHPAR